ncbi:MAG: hydrogenase assembly chaperone [Candidatus Methanofastidiosum methylothiophilum]|jgi:hydrogenase expression/formation protein HypC|uniref:Hydrogenase assembly chaperone n=1 Tax=Candidatus Methanofastidiosum methylothiophilum TaxID=1705564 RepID=A0A150JDV0_9EURY|nr:MAG: hydrogenase assembly chaperone [Candidatus Methanofastidiosum methylthiophilus]MBP6931901.1 HypC/HybG/HupF family hydrogenase formation chaperone [Methanofastidiosum sp.]OQC52148.1 MAG: hydrogenase assembly chaperone [Euryarchaeota archaeon ADurb.Bin023]KYC57175.1 MAG: hydrogenase assembly chaperone [Candidatus Methanofastidiosum methylthiophilus]KYC57931.1 MAG: hydrogenase assembly chaperone [Candidatus Methanofastidiosum methylthiophilus]
MCLAVPGKVEKIKGDVGIVNFNGVKREVRLDLVDVKIGDYVIVHTGFAIEKMDEKDALESLDIWKELLKAEEDY